MEKLNITSWDEIAKLLETRSGLAFVALEEPGDSLGITKEICILSSEAFLHMGYQETPSSVPSFDPHKELNMLSDRHRGKRIVTVGFYSADDARYPFVGQLVRQIYDRYKIPELEQFLTLLCRLYG